MSARPRRVDPAVAAAALRRSPRRGFLTPTLLLLTFATGVVDAISYLAIGSVFTANMTGNLVLIGFAVGGTPGFSVSRTIVSLAAFALGAVVGGRIAATWHPKPFVWMQRVTRLELALLVVAAMLTTAIPVGVETPDSPLRYLVVVVLAVAMGMRNATVRRLGFSDVPTTVATSTITDLATESRFGGGERRNQPQRVAAIGLMLLGAAVGAIVVREISTLAAFVLALAAVAGAALHQHAIARRHSDAAHAG